MAKPDITLSELSSILKYDPDTGIFRWRITHHRVKFNQIAGTKQEARNCIQICIAKKMYKAHRLAFIFMTGSYPKGVVDHINGDGFDNRWDNLRDVSQAVNARNCKLSKNNTSGITGVYFDKSRSKWAASIKVNKKVISLGRFDTIEEAAAIRKDAERNYLFHANHGRSF